MTLNRILWPRPRIHESKARLPEARMAANGVQEVPAMYHNYVGIDMAAATFTAAWQTGSTWHDTTLDQRRGD